MFRFAAAAALASFLLCLLAISGCGGKPDSENGAKPADIGAEASSDEPSSADEAPTASEKETPSVPKDYEKMPEPELRRAAQSGDTEAQFRLGTRLAKAGDGEAVKWWTKAAEGGHAEAQFAWGMANVKTGKT